MAIPISSYIFLCLLWISPHLECSLRDIFSLSHCKYKQISMRTQHRKGRTSENEPTFEENKFSPANLPIQSFANTAHNSSGSFLSRRWHFPHSRDFPRKSFSSGRTDRIIITYSKFFQFEHPID